MTDNKVTWNLTVLKELATIIGVFAALFAVAVLIFVGLFKIVSWASSEGPSSKTTTTDSNDYPVTREVCSDMYDMRVSQGQRPSLPRATMIDDCVEEMTP